MTSSNTSVHEESWFLLPWFANGRLAGAQRALVEEHLRECPACAEEAELQRHMCAALTEPERVTYAPGPSFRKLMERIDGQSPAPTRLAAVARTRAAGSHLTAAWRPPGFAWAASFLLTVGLGTLLVTTYQWSQPRYVTYTAQNPTSDVLRIAFDRSLPVGEVEALLRSAGARVVEGPDSTGVFGVTPTAVAEHPAGEVSPQLRALAARLSADARVRWIAPVGPETTPSGAQGTRQPAH
jgi:hypothetical protein